MSVADGSPFVAVDRLSGPFRFQVVCAADASVMLDTFRSFGAAVAAASLLNSGDAALRPCETLGCRVVVAR